METGDNKTATATPVAQVHHITELTGYQPGAVVSRVILKRKAGNVTLFAFDLGQELSEHTAPFDALVQVVHGEAEITVAGKPLRAGVGDMVIMPAHQPHAIRAVTPMKMLLTMVRDQST